MSSICPICTYILGETGDPKVEEHEFVFLDDGAVVVRCPMLVSSETLIGDFTSRIFYTGTARP